MHCEIVPSVTLWKFLTFIFRSYSTIFTIYRVDTNDPGFHLLVPPKRRTHERYEGSPVAAGKLWAFGWSRGSRRLMAVGSIFNSQRQELVMDIGTSKFQASRYMVGWPPRMNLTTPFRTRYRFYQRGRSCSRAAQAWFYTIFQSYGLAPDPPASSATVQYGVTALSPRTYTCIPTPVRRKQDQEKPSLF